MKTGTFKKPPDSPPTLINANMMGSMAYMNPE
jgi:hypothetical protein